MGTLSWRLSLPLQTQGRSDQARGDPGRPRKTVNHGARVLALDDLLTQIVVVYVPEVNTPVMLSFSLGLPAIL